MVKSRTGNRKIHSPQITLRGSWVDLKLSKTPTPAALSAEKYCILSSLAAAGEVEESLKYSFKYIKPLSCFSNISTSYPGNDKKEFVVF